jgi:hypothetical protein
MRAQLRGTGVFPAAFVIWTERKNAGGTPVSQSCEQDLLVVPGRLA